MAKSDYKKLLKAHKEKSLIIQNKEWYTVRSIVGNTWAYFFLLVGAREAGKSYSVMQLFLSEWKKKGKPFTWMRLKDAAVKNLLENNGEKLIDPDLARKFNLNLKVKGKRVYDGDRLMANVISLSAFYNDKGTALFDNEDNRGFNICLDEANLEQGERRQGDIAYQFVNQLENIVRSSKEKIRIFIIMNDTDACGDILALFNFVPEKWGRYKIRKKKAVIDYMPPSEKYKNRRAGAVANILMGEKATFSNHREVDKRKIFKGRLLKPTAIIVFNKDTKFTVWDGRVIKEFKNEKCEVQIAMQPYIDMLFIPENRDNVIAMYDSEYLLYRDLITQLKFTKELQLLKPRK